MPRCSATISQKFPHSTENNSAFLCFGLCVCVSVRKIRFILGADNSNKQLKANIYAYFMKAELTCTRVFLHFNEEWPEMALAKFIELELWTNPLKSNRMAKLFVDFRNKLVKKTKKLNAYFGHLGAFTLNLSLFEKTKKRSHLQRFRYDSKKTN